MQNHWRSQTPPYWLWCEPGWNLFGLNKSRWCVQWSKFHWLTRLRTQIILIGVPQPHYTGWLKRGLVMALTSTYSDKSGAVKKFNEWKEEMVAPKFCSGLDKVCLAGHALLALAAPRLLFIVDMPVIQKNIPEPTPCIQRSLLFISSLRSLRK